MKKLFLFIVLACGVFYWYSGNRGGLQGSYGEAHDELIMYSLTTCGYCRKKARELHQENIAFTEYFIDKDKAKRDELNRKLSAAGFRPQRYGTPIFDVGGVMLPNNPDMRLIKEKLYR